MLYYTYTRAHTYSHLYSHTYAHRYIRVHTHMHMYAHMGWCVNVQSRCGYCSDMFVVVANYMFGSEPYCDDELGCFPLDGEFSERLINFRPNRRDVINTTLLV